MGVLQRRRGIGCLQYGQRRVGWAGGAWQTGNPWRRSQERVYENPLFTTSVNLTGFVSSAPSASVVAAGDMDASSEGADDLNFPAKVVHYFGLESCPGESGGIGPASQSPTPFAAFHAPECPSGIIVPESPCGGVSDCVLPEESDAGRTLCYEDRDGAAGCTAGGTVWWRCTPEGCGWRPGCGFGRTTSKHLSVRTT